VVNKQKTTQTKNNKKLITDSAKTEPNTLHILSTLEESEC